MGSEQIDNVVERLDRIEEALRDLARLRQEKEWYTTAEAADIVGRAEYTVREWARQGRIRAEKKGSGRGKYQSWVISRAELLRFQREGLLPER
ncbi:MAG TPA: helix-turn-helix domain-containing protein [Gemmataceae bacterium]|jgi:excisionase family DNA binding protein|nr:helix-turn-helix domain-containing protein [Gemmataceae bacterium]